MIAYRQGDVILVKGEIPKNAVKQDHLILAKGEVTGHQHQITEGNAMLYEKEGTLFLHVESETAVLTHEEHKPIVLPQGDYQILIQREYIPNSWQNVVD